MGPSPRTTLKTSETMQQYDVEFQSCHLSLTGVNRDKPKGYLAGTVPRVLFPVGLVVAEQLGEKHRLVVGFDTEAKKDVWLLQMKLSSTGSTSLSSVMRARA